MLLPQKSRLSRSMENPTTQLSSVEDVALKEVELGLKQGHFTHIANKDLLQKAEASGTTSTPSTTTTATTPIERAEPRVRPISAPSPTHKGVDHSFPQSVSPTGRTPHPPPEARANKTRKRAGVDDLTEISRLQREPKITAGSNGSELPTL